MLQKLGEKLSLNFNARAKNKVFWLSMLSVILLLIKQVLEVFGISIDFSILEGQLKSIIETIFMLLALLGIVIDPTTDGVKDSEEKIKSE